MNKLIYAPLIILVIVAIFYSSYQASSSFGTTAYNQTQANLNGGNLVNNTQTTYTQSGQNLNFIVTEGIYALIVVVVGCILLALVGLNVLGSGLGDASVDIIYKTTIYYILWGVCTALGGYSAFSSIPDLFGVLGWFVMTLIFTVGIIQSINSHS